MPAFPTFAIPYLKPFPEQEYYYYEAHKGIGLPESKKVICTKTDEKGN